jgi:large subunit ribosomal protein L6
MSRIGKKPIILPQGTQLEFKEGEVFVTGPRGSLKRPFLKGLTLSMDGSIVTVSRTSEEKTIRGYHGLMRTLIANMVEGVSKGFEKKLEIVGIGYRAEFQSGSFTFYLGYSHPIIFTLPEGITGGLESRHRCPSRG